MKKNIIFICVLLTGLFNLLQAQQPQEIGHKKFFEGLAKPDSISHAVVKVVQDVRIEKLVVGVEAVAVQTVSGYRVQVFSTNVQRTGKTEAFQVEKDILEQFPDVAVYVNYTSPSWKVRVGDFINQAEALSFKENLISAFPALRRGIYVVPEQVIIHDKNK